MTKQTKVNPATKAQVEALIDLVKDAGMNEEAGLLKLATDQISKKLHKDEPLCVCLEVIGDNGTCPVHGPGFEQAKADYFTDYGADYQERNDLYSFAMGC